MKKKTIALVLACILCVGIGIGGTLAWLTANSGPVTNTFTTSNIDITLDEGDDLDLKMIPGWTISKDPTVTVLKDSEDCWLFVQIDEGNGVGNYITYVVEENWTKGDGTNIPANVYYRKVTDITADTDFIVIGNKGSDGTADFEANKVLVKEGVTKAMMDSFLDDDGNVVTADLPTLTFTAYATQLYKNNTTQFTAAEAWDNIPTT